MPTDPALCKRLAEGVMKWHSSHVGLLPCWFNAEGRSPLGLLTLWESDWHPDTDIAQAMAVAERIGSQQDCEVAIFCQSYMKESERWSCQVVCEENRYWGHASTPAAAISEAADAWLRQGVRR
jgi:Phage ABA sandwich domain